MDTIEEMAREIVADSVESGVRLLVFYSSDPGGEAKIMRAAAAACQEINRLLYRGSPVRMAVHRGPVFRVIISF